MTDRLSITFAALADPTRRAILARLALGETTVNELAAPFKISQPAISRHLKVLERAGLVARGREAQWRPCRLEAGPLREVDQWLAHYQRFWEQSFDRLDSYLKELQAKELPAKRPHGKASPNPSDPTKIPLAKGRNRKKQQSMEATRGHKKRS
jgi:DNA-binding transcriptional ArsR family regulator